MKQCQSCGLPLHKDPNGRGGGIHKDGSISDLYCSLCYVDGEFMYKGTDVEEFKNIVEDAMKQSGYGRFMRTLTRRNIPHLARWKWTRTLKDLGYPYIYQRHDAPGISYERHCHQDKVCVCVLGGDVTFTRDDTKYTRIDAGNMFEILPQHYHTAQVGSQGCDYIVGEMIEGDS